MILVTDLKKITCCPNCGNSDLEGWYNIDTRKDSKYCDKCDEEILEKEPDLCVVGVDFENRREFTINEGVSTVTTTYATAAERLRELGQETDMLVIREMCDIIADIFDRRHIEIMARLNR